MPETFEIIDPLERFMEAREDAVSAGVGIATGSRPHKALWLAGAAMFAISTLILVKNPQRGEFASGGQAFADCVPSPNTPASVIEYFQNSTRHCRNDFALTKTPPPRPSTNLLPQSL